MTSRLITIILILSSFTFSNSLFAQTDSNLTGWIRVGFNSYHETKQPFSFSSEDKSQFQLPNGIFLTVSYYRLLSKHFFCSINTGYGHFKNATITDNLKSTTYSADVIPLTLLGDFSIIELKRFGLGIVGGAGFHWVDLSRVDNILKKEESNQGFYFTYIYGPALTYQIGGIILTVNYLINNFDNRQFKSIGINIPVYTFRKTK